MRYLVLDFETKDPYLSKSIGLGPGWVYKLHVEGALSRAIGFSYLIVDGKTIGPPTYLACTDQNVALLKDLVRDHPNIIMHNAQYDLGYLLTLGIPIHNIKVYDTKIIARLYDSTLMSYSLNDLSTKFLHVESRKEKANLVDVVEKHSLISMKPTCKTYYAAAEKWAYENMDIIQEIDFAAMARYANQDVVATAALFLKFMDRISLTTAHYWSHFQLICAKNRAKGLAVSMDAVHKGIEYLTPIEKRLHDEVFILAGKEFNLNSPKQLSEILNVDCTDKEALSLLSNPIAKAILEYREVNKILRDFLINIRDMQIYSCPEAAAGASVGRIFPEMTLFGAKTGRFSSSKPNIQQIPKRSEKYGKLCRSMFIPDDAEKGWYSLDWSNQEGRLAVHYASLANCEGSVKIAKMWNQDPRLDMHQKVADMASITRSQAKTINLGLLYSMGQATLCKKLNLPTKQVNINGRIVEVAGAEGKELLRLYNEANPWLQELNEKAESAMKNRLGVLTLGSRLLRRIDKGCEYRALNKIIQGSAADQMLWALRKADDAGIDIKCIVHDEFNVEGKEDAAKMKEIMESSECYGVELRVPMVAELNTGPSWGELGE